MVSLSNHMQENLSRKITILGAGAWGQAIAQLLYQNNHPADQIVLWCHTSLVIQDLPDCPDLIITTDLTFALAHSQLIFIAIPIQYLRTILSQIQQHTGSIPLVLLAKGLERTTGLVASEIAQEIFGSEATVAVLSGPSFAQEVRQQQPTTVMLATSTTQTQLAHALQNLLTNKYFQVQLTTDRWGVQICAAYKNILALGAGLLQGAGYQANTRASFLTQGLQELTKILQGHSSHETQTADPVPPETHPQAPPAAPDFYATVYGLAGLGDLILTATSTQSRNFQVGAQLGAGVPLTTILQTPAWANCEALNTLMALASFTPRLKIRLPLAQVLQQIVYQGAPVTSLLQVMGFEK